MRFGGSLFLRTFSAYFLLCCGIIAALSFYAADRLHAIRFEGEKRTLLDESRLAYQLIQSDLEQARVQSVDEQLRSISIPIGCRFTLIAADGRVISDTEAVASEMENHRLRPEIVAAAAHGEGSSVRFSHTLNEEMMYLARREKSANGKVYFLRMAVPLAKLYRNLKWVDINIAMAGFVAAVVAGITCFTLARRQALRLQQLADMSRAIAQGGVGRRSHLDASGELGQLSRDLNTISENISTLKTDSDKARADLDAIVSSMSDGLIAADLQQRIVLVNAASSALLDFQHVNACGKMLWEVIHDEALLSTVSQVASSGQAAIVQSGPRRGKHIEVAISPLKHNSANDGVLIVARDATRSIQYQELRKEFVANVSHELRTPLTLIKGYVETLQDGALTEPERARSFLNTIEKNVNQLTNLVNDLLEISRLESRAGLPRRSNVNLSETIHKVVDLLAPAAAKKKQKIQFESPERAISVSGDADYLERAISNLVDNAIKYTPEAGMIEIRTSIEDANAIIDVIDSGIGIPQNDLPRIFERFYRVDKSRSREMGGTGLGLAIVKHIAQAHGGTISATSQPGKGSRFRFILPALSG